MIVTLSTFSGNGVIADTLATFVTEPSGAAPFYKLTDLAGWISGGYRPDQAVEEASGDGGIGAATLFRGAKVMAILGVIHGGTAQANALAWERLVALPNDPIMLTVDDFTGIQKRMVVWLNGPVAIDPIRANAAKVMIPIVAADPRKYSTELETLTLSLSNGSTTSISASFTNEGTAPAPIVGRIAAGSIPLNRFPIKWQRTTDTSYSANYGEELTGASNYAITATFDHGGVAYGTSTGAIAPGGLSLGMNGWPMVNPGVSTSMRITCAAGTGVPVNVYLDFRSAWW